MPEAKEVEVAIDERDLQIDVYRSSGPGGQSVNTTDSAVRITHLPSGIVVTCQNERSQHKNRDVAMKLLRAKLYQLEVDKRKDEQTKIEGEKKEIGFGSQIRSYVLDDRRVKDHRTNVETSQVENVLDRGELDPFIDAELRRKKKVVRTD